MELERQSHELLNDMENSKADKRIITPLNSNQCNLCPSEKYFRKIRKMRRRVFSKASKIAYRIRTGLCYAEPRA